MKKAVFILLSVVVFSCDSGNKKAESSESKDAIVTKTTDKTAEAPDKVIKQSYARHSTISTKNGKLYGCFNSDFSAACEETKITSIQLGAIVQNQYAGDCSEGAGGIDCITHN